MTEIDVTGLTRRDVIKRSVVVGGLIWIAPTVLASPAGASVYPCTGCTGTVFGLRHTVDAGCTTPGSDPGNADNCGVQPIPGGSISGFQSGCCLLAAGLVTFSESADNQTHTYGFMPGVTICGGAFGRCSGVCKSQFDVEVTEYFDDPSDPTRITRVTIVCAGLTHSEVYVCVEGSNLPVGC
ncbi:MAG: hypothetical protein ACR2MO_17655 [Acidimicrobiales bacterium]